MEAMRCKACDRPRASQSAPVVLLVHEENYYTKRVGSLCMKCWVLVEKALEGRR